MTSVLICGGDPGGKMHLLMDFTDRRKGAPAKPTRGIRTTSKPPGRMCWLGAKDFWKRV